MRRAQRWMLGGLITGLVAFALVAVDEVFAGPLHQSDTIVNDAVSNLQQSGAPMHLLGLAFTQFGAWYTVTVVVAAVALWMVMRKERALAAWTVGIAIGMSLIVDGLKFAFKRARPPVLTDVLKSYSFPSGHTMGATGAIGAAILLGAEVYVRKKHPARQGILHVWAMALALWASVAFLTGLGRVLMQQHWMTDVIASWALGLALIAGILFVLSRQQPAGEPGPKVPESLPKPGKPHAAKPPETHK